MYHNLDRGFSEDEVVFIDCKLGTYSYDHPQFPKTTLVRPDIQADLRQLPLRSGLFTLVIFDPPHDQFGKNSYMNLRYGSLSVKQYEDMLRIANEEFSRVLQPGGCILVKLMDRRTQMTKRALKNFKPLLDISRKSLSQRSRSRTHHILFVKSACTEFGTE